MGIKFEINTGLLNSTQIIEMPKIYPVGIMIKIELR